VLESIASGIGAALIERADVTLPAGQMENFGEIKDDEMLVIGAPVYAGRLPETALQRFRGIKSLGSPAVLVVLYGNREYEDALLELSDLVCAAGCVPVAAGAFIGEHSFSTPAIPLAKGRPDADDVGSARAFGESIAAHLKLVPSLKEIQPLQLPGNRPFRDRPRLPVTSPDLEEDRCTACGACAAVCPTGSIIIGEKADTKADTCILCCACVRACPETIRRLKDPRVGAIIEWLRSNTSRRKEPEHFFAPCRSVADSQSGTS
jgi:ferredoxin